MKVLRHISRNALWLLCSVTVSLLMSGCVREDYSDCSCTTTTEMVLYIKVSTSAESGRSSAAEVDNATVYIFGEGGLLERTVDVDREDIEQERPIEITYRSDLRPQVVVWGNLKGNQEVSPLPIGSPISEGWIRLLTMGAYALAPDDLYYGYRTLNNEPEQEVVITPHVGRVNVTVRGVENVQGNHERYHFTLQTQYGGYDFYAAPPKSQAVFHSGAAPGPQPDDLVTIQPVNMTLYPTTATDDAVIVNFYEDDHLLASTTTAEDGGKIIPRAGKNTNVLIRFGPNGSIGVTIKITPWDVIEQWVEW